jgi:hypothetical protein
MRRRHILAIAIYLAAGLVVGPLQAAQNTGGTTTEPSSCVQCRKCNISKKDGCGNSRACTAECNRACTDCTVRGLSVIQFTTPKPYRPGAELPSSKIQPQ